MTNYEKMDGYMNTAKMAVYLDSMKLVAKHLDRARKAMPAMDNSLHFRRVLSGFGDFFYGHDVRCALAVDLRRLADELEKG